MYNFWPFSPFWDRGGFIIFGRLRHFWTLTNLLFFAVFAILDPDGLNIFGPSHHFGTLTDLLFLAVFTILGR